MTLSIMRLGVRFRNNLKLDPRGVNIGRATIYMGSPTISRGRSTVVSVCLPDALVLAGATVRGANLGLPRHSMSYFFVQDRRTKTYEFPGNRIFHYVLIKY